MSEQSNPTEIAQRNIQLAERYSRTVDSAPPFLSVLTVAKAIPDNDSRMLLLDGSLEKTKSEEYNILLHKALAARNADEAGFSQANFSHKDNPKMRITISRAQTEEGMGQYAQEVDFLPTDLTYPAICISVGELESVSTPFGNLPPHAIDTQGNEVWFSNTFILDNKGQGYQVQAVNNIGNPNERDPDSEEQKEIARLPHIQVAANDSDSRAIPLAEDHFRVLESIISQIETGEFIPKNE